MKVVGLVTEYNPFHNGHGYHIEEAKRITGADYAIAVMSGSFVQRGAPAIIDKYSRAKMALHSGVDLVMELPVCYAAGSAEYFALGAVSLLDSLGIVDYLCFGSECGDIDLIKAAAKLIAKEPDAYKEALLTYIRNGYAYPAARARAVEEYLRSNGPGSIHENSLNLLREPNNILGIEYVKALLRIHSPMVPVTIRRKSAHYHDSELSSEDFSDDTFDSFSNSTLHPITKSILTPTCSFRSAAELDTHLPVGEDIVGESGIRTISSATAVRNVIVSAKSGEDLARIKDSVPEEAHRLLTEHFQKTYPITWDDFAPIIRYRLLNETNSSLASYADFTNDLADRIKKADYNKDFDTLAQTIKSKNITLTRVTRALAHILLNITDANLQQYLAGGYVYYARPLGIRKESSHLLRKISEKGRIPVITKVSAAEKMLGDIGMQMLSEDLFATHVYNQAVFEKYRTTIPNEYKHGVIIL